MRLIPLIGLTGLTLLAIPFVMLFYHAAVGGYLLETLSKVPLIAWIQIGLILLAFVAILLSVSTFSFITGTFFLLNTLATVALALSTGSFSFLNELNFYLLLIGPLLLIAHYKLSRDEVDEATSEEDSKGDASDSF